MTITTRQFPSALIARVSDLIPRHCRSVRIWDNEDGTAGASADASEITALRNAIRIARTEVETAHIR